MTDTYHVAKDGYGEEALWRGQPGADDVYLVVYRYLLDGQDPVLWPTLVAALTGHAVCLPEDLEDQLRFVLEETPYIGEWPDDGGLQVDEAYAALRLAEKIRSWPFGATAGSDHR